MNRASLRDHDKSGLQRIIRSRLIIMRVLAACPAAPRSSTPCIPWAATDALFILFFIVSVVRSLQQ